LVGALSARVNSRPDTKLIGRYGVGLGCKPRAAALRTLFLEELWAGCGARPTHWVGSPLAP
jgi:hypothetical protein